jgi:hypothetical protein
VADQSTTWGFNLDAKQLKGEAASAAQALKKLEDTITSDKKALSGMNAAMKAMTKGGVVDIKSFADLTARAKALEGQIGANTNTFAKLGGAFGKTTHGSEEAKSALVKMSRQLAKTGGPVGSLASRFAGFTELMGSSKLAMIAMGVGAVATAVAIGAAAVKLFELASASAEARREEKLALEGTTSLKDGWKNAATSAGFLQSAIDEVSSSSAASRDKVAGYAKQLWTAGLRGMALKNALKAMATTAVAQGEAAATAFGAVAASTYAAGGSVKKLAETVDTQIGGIANAHLYDTAVLAAKLHDNIAGLFKDVNVDGLNEARRSFVDLFDTSTVSGRQLARILKPISQWLVNIATSLTSGLTKAIMTAITWELKLETAWLRFEAMMVNLAVDVRDTMLDAWDEISDQWELGLAALGMAIYGAAPAIKEMATNAWDLAKASASAAKGLWKQRGAILANVKAMGAEAIASIAAGATALWGLAGAAWSAAGGMLATAAPFLAVGAAILAVVWAFKTLWDNWDELMSVDYGALGKYIIDGLVGGIKDAAHWALDAVKNLGASMWKGFKTALGIHSPSKVFASLGLQIPRGIVAGIAAGQPALDRSVAAMVDATAIDAPGFTVVAPNLAGGGGAGSTVAGGSATNVTNYVTLTFDISSDSPKQAGESVRDQVISVFQTLGRQMAVV